ncbi:glycerol-3-phosphate dehydrogenase, mitochondrial 1 [Colletotrichum higginsianum]|nr:glycerol-3-phosphate dehydrogenase, mitochondrial 1 [Colletotrichum higginsianum]
MGLVDPSTSGGRVTFFPPWQDKTIAGTTNEPASITPNPLPDEKSIGWIPSSTTATAPDKRGERPSFEAQTLLEALPKVMDIVTRELK